MAARRLVISFELPGIPTPMPRPRLRGSHVFVPASVRAWKDTIAIMARNAHPGLTPQGGRFRVEAVILGTPRGDIDNIAKTILDGLNGIVYQDDRQVVQLEVKIDQEATDGTTIIRVYQLDGEGV